MKKYMIPAAAVLLAAALLGGCMPTDKTSIQINPDFSVPDRAEIDFTELHNETLSIFESDEAPAYLFIDGVDISGDDAKRTIYVDATAISGTSAEDAQHFAAAVLRHMNDAATTQYSGYELSTPTSFGPLYDDFSVTIAVTDTETAAMIYQIELPAGKDIPLDPNIEKYEDEWARAFEVYMDNVVYGADGSIVYTPDRSTQ